MNSDLGRFEVRLAASPEEIASAQRLRYTVFVEEMGASAEGADHHARLEQDDFDAYFDHLILIDKERDVSDPLDRVIGVYRLMRGEVARSGSGFYGASEYDLVKIENSQRRCVELGRSCVHRDYRGGTSMLLLWNGLAKYVLDNEIEVMFGVASFHGTDVQKFAHALAHLHHNHLAPEDLRVRAREAHYQKMDLLPPDQTNRELALEQTPALIKAYLRLGGFVGEGAFIDCDFNTIDVCLIMDTARMGERYLKYYKRSEKAG